MDESLQTYREAIIHGVQAEKTFANQYDMYVHFARLLILAVIYIGDCIRTCNGSTK